MATYLLTIYQFCFHLIYLIRILNLFTFVLVLENLCVSSHSSQVQHFDKYLSHNFTYYNETKLLRHSRSLPQKPHNDNSKQTFESMQNGSLPVDLVKMRQIWEQIYGKMAMDEMTRNEQLVQMSAWLSNEDALIPDDTPYIQESTAGQIHVNNDPEKISGRRRNADFGTAEALKAEKLKNQQQVLKQSQTQSVASISHKSEGEESENGNRNHNYESYEEDGGPSGTTKTPPCAHYGRYYCSYKEDYPIKVVTEVTKYYKWPLEKLFRDLRHQVMPTLANDNSGGLVCDSITRIIRAGWAKNTNGRWLVVINTDYYQQYITEVICRHGTGSYCNFIPPCYHASCRQRYNTQKLLVIDPWNPYKGPFLSEFLFPSCCVCYIPGDTHDSQHSASNVRDKFTGIHSNHQTTSEKASSLSPIEVSSQPPA